MDTTALPSRISRLDRRSLYRARNTKNNRRQETSVKREEPPTAPVADYPVDQDEHQRTVMGRPHHDHHRRAAQVDAVVDSAATKVLTVNIEVIATVDTSGNVVGQETRTQADPLVPTQSVGIPNPVVDVVPPVPAVPATPVASAIVDSAGAAVSPILDPVGSVISPLVALAAAVVDSVIPSVAAVPPLPVAQPSPSLPQVPPVPAFPTNALPTVPSVPAVPSFPSDLRVPSYPWPSGVSAQAAVATTAPTVASPVLTSTARSSATPGPISAAPNPSSNSTLSNASSLSGSLKSTASTIDSISGSARTSLGNTLSSDATISSVLQSVTGSLTSRGTTLGGGGGDGGGSPNTAIPPAQATLPIGVGAGVGAGTGASTNNTPLQTPQVVGSVVGSLAGAALILAIILLLLRRHKRKRRGDLQLTGNERHDNHPVMTQDMSRSNRIPSAFLHRFSGMSRSTAETSTSGGERSFQRVSGRKLPSAFSEGMTSEQFSRGGTMSGSSFYQDDQGTYGGPGLAKDFGKEVGASMAAGAAAMNMRPSPARTPVVRHPDDDTNPFSDSGPFPQTQSHLSPPQSPNPDLRRGTLGRSLHSADGSRSSKFTENV